MRCVDAYAASTHRWGVTVTPETPKRQAARSRLRVAAVLGVASLLLAILAVLGPARQHSQDYTWPPSALPAASPTKAWYTPLFLSARRPETVTVRLPCALPQTLRDSTRRPGGAFVLATSRNPLHSTRFAIRRLERSLVVTIEERPLTRIAWPPVGAEKPGCERIVRAAADRWEVRTETGRLLESGPAPPFVVTGLLSDLDLRADPTPYVTVSADVTGTSPTRRQISLSVVAGLLAVISIALALIPDRRPAARGVAGAVAKGLRSLAPVDAVVVSALLVWWVVGPTFTDDGWVLVRERNFQGTGTFSTYFDNIGVEQPFGYWYEWLHHWLALATTSLPLLRVPVLVLGLASWLLCRWILTRALETELCRAASVRATLAAAFLVGFLSWGLTLRPEPIVSFLAGVALAAMVVFARYPTLGPLALGLAAAALAVSAHPEGLVALAPIVAGAPIVVTWIRTEGRQLVLPGVAMLSSVAAFGALLMFVDSDVAQRTGSSAAIRGFSRVTALDWRDELIRYTRLSEPEWGTALRRASVALMLLALVAFACRRRVGNAADLAGRSLALGLVALLLTPSKWPWHFGALVVVGAVAVGVEAAQFARATRDGRGWSIRPLVVGLVVVAAGAWAWSYRSSWSPFDLRSHGWPPDIGELIAPLDGVALSSLLTWVLLLLYVIAGVGIVQILRKSRRGLGTVPWTVAAWIVPLIALPLLVTTMGTFTRDALTTEGWTLARQNVGSFVGRAGCGLADDLLLPDPRTFIPLSATAASGDHSIAGGLEPPPLSGVGAWGPLFDGVAPQQSVTPWYRVPPRGSIGLFVAGHTEDRRTLRAEWATETDRGVTVAQAGRVRAPARTPVDANRTFSWRFLAEGDLPIRPRRATLVRFVANNRRLGPDWAIAFSGPVSYEAQSMSARLREAKAVVHPALGLDFPCAEHPTLARGVVEVPSTLALLSIGVWPRDDITSPFAAVDDGYVPLELSTADSEIPAPRMSVFAVDLSPRSGEVIAPVDATRP